MLANVETRGARQVAQLAASVSTGPEAAGALTSGPVTYTNASGRYELRPMSPVLCAVWICNEPATHELAGPELHPQKPYLLCEGHGLERLGALL